MPVHSSVTTRSLLALRAGVGTLLLQAMDAVWGLRAFSALTGLVFPALLTA